ncbi:ABC-2 family transporter protein [Caloramator quimbayensis]|uniref:ABC-2 family transporter protein n=1 Tax=Caloramator quimbayensis TaxID=1147123 RepID=A0A1T4WLC7_9CLOT|nr:ABC-2 transporter permease [Caloramator quimbayensis]SKA78156.1 ABC-2 family transporter protein [Caloramator quimbayensis]
MLSLILKDLLIQKKNLIFAFLYIIFIMLSIQSKIMGATLSICICAISYITLSSASAYDDRSNGNIFLNTLPISREKIVLSKYISLFIYAAFTTAIYFIIYIITSSLNLKISLYPVTLEGIIYGLFLVSIMYSLSLPIFFKFGYMKAKWIQFIIFFLFFGGISYIIKFLESRFSNILLDFGGSKCLIMLLIIILSFIILFISYCLSVYFYKRREF